MRVRPPSIATVLWIATLTGCSSMSNAAAVPSLDGTAWVLSDLPGHTVPTDRPATIAFQGGKAGGHDGCNRFNAPYTASEGTIAFSPAASTMMACEPQRTALATAFSGALSGARRYRVQDGRLQFLGADGAVLAGFGKQVQELAGTSWKATGINNGKGGVASVVGGSAVTLAFGADGRASGSAGCNNFTAGYTAEGSSLRFGPAAVTRKMCAEAGVMEQEAAFLRALESVATSRVEGDKLELRTADGALAAMFAREAGA